MGRYGYQNCARVQGPISLKSWWNVFHQEFLNAEVSSQNWETGMLQKHKGWLSVTGVSLCAYLSHTVWFWTLLETAYRAKESGLCCYAQLCQGFLLCLLVLQVEVTFVSCVCFLLNLRGNSLSTWSRRRYHSNYLGRRADLKAVLKRLQNFETVFFGFLWEQRGV